MKHTLCKTFAAAGAAALLLAGCNSDGGTDEASGDASGGDDPVYAAMAGWNACEVLDHLQPITDFMAIEGYGGSGRTGGAPGNSEIGNTLDPDAIGCNGLISVSAAEEYANMMGDGEIKVKIVPAEGEEQAATAYQERAAGAETEASSGENATTAEVGGPWDEGVLVAWTGSAETNRLEVVARDGQWVFHIQLHYGPDFGLRNEDVPAYEFTNEELHQWLVETYLPGVNQTVNDKIAEVR